MYKRNIWAQYKEEVRMRTIMDLPCHRYGRSTSGYAWRKDGVVGRNVWILEDVGSNISKDFNIPIIVDKIIIIIGIGWGGRKGEMTKHIIIGLRHYILMMSWMGMKDVYGWI